MSRVTFNEITSSAIKKAIDSPREIDQDLVDAYLARRILDHLIGLSFSSTVETYIELNLLEEFNLDFEDTM